MYIMFFINANMGIQSFKKRLQLYPESNLSEAFSLKLFAQSHLLGNRDLMTIAMCRRFQLCILRKNVSYNVRTKDEISCSIHCSLKSPGTLDFEHLRTFPPPENSYLRQKRTFVNNVNSIHCQHGNHHLTTSSAMFCPWVIGLLTVDIKF